MTKPVSVFLSLILCVSFLVSCGSVGFSDSSAVNNVNNAEVNNIISDMKAAQANISAMDFEFTNRDNNANYSEESATKINFNGSSVTVSGNGASVSGSTVTLSKAETYILSGETDDGMVIVNCGDDDKLQIVLDGVSIYNKNGPAFYVKNADKVAVTLASGSENTLSDGASYSYKDGSSNVDATLFSRADISFNGSGKLTVNGNNKHGICSKDDLVFTGGVYSVKSSGVAINGKDCVKISGGVFTLDAGSDGIRSDNEEDADRGYVYICGGVFNIEAGNDGIQAQTVLKTDGGTFDIRCGGGSANASTKQDGGFNDNWGFGGNDFGGRPGGFKPGFRSMSYSSSSTSASNNESAKGIKAGSDIIVTGGSFLIDSADDSVHSNGTVEIKNGAFEITSGDDGIHADTSLVISGGEIKIAKSYEGLESSDIVINGGKNYVTATDDGINAAGGNDQSSMGNRPGMGGFTRSSGRIAISGGYSVIDASGDGIDSNGDVTVAGGITIVYGPTNGANGAFDYDGNATLMGGTFIAIGSSGMAQGFTKAEGQGAFATNVNGIKVGTSIAVCDAEGNVLVGFYVKKQASHVVVSCKGVQSGNEYTVVGGAELSGTNEDGFAENTVKNGGEILATVKMTSNLYGSFGHGAGMGGKGGRP